MRLIYRYFWLLCFGVACRPGTIPAGNPTLGILFVSERDGNEEIYLIQADGNGLTRLTDNPEVDSDPAWSPDGRQIAFRSRRDGSSDIFVMTADGGRAVNLIQDPRTSFNDEFAPRWNVDGLRLALYTDRFSGVGCTAHQLAWMTLTDGAEAITPILNTSAETFGWSPDGRYLVYSGRCGSDTLRFYVWDSQTNGNAPLPIPLPFVAFPAYSHDGRFLAFQGIDGEKGDIYLLEWDSGRITNLTNHPANDSYPTWSPDNSQIAFSSDRDGNQEIYVMNVDGSSPVNISQHPAKDFRPAWSPISHDK